jgi:NAD dependent epimerase/dehydratase family enzyme
MYFSTLTPLLLAPLAAAICPGFNYGIGNQQALGNGISRWTIYDDGCNAVDSLTTTKNPCTTGTFGCSPPPIIFNRYTNTFTHLM